jgi:pyruvate carboxylase subunit B
VFHALPGVRGQLGQVPLVTPTSQIVGTQTVNNVLFDKEGESYTRITQQVKDLCYGLYGRTPRPIDRAVQRKALQDYPRGQKPITRRPGEILEPELETARRHAGELAKDLDDLLIFALFPVTGKRFLMWKYGLEEPPQETRPKTLEEVKREQELVRRALAGELVEKGQGAQASPAAAPPPPATLAGREPAGTGASRRFEVTVNGEPFVVEVRESGGARRFVAEAGPAAPPRRGEAPREAAAAEEEAPAAGEEPVRAPMPGMVVEYRKRVGEAVKAGETVVIVEAMKMHNSIESPCDGVVKELRCRPGESVPKAAVLCVIARS